MNNKVIILGPGKQTRGGITSVIKAHKQTETWKKWNCIWIETYIDRSSFYKIIYFIKGLLKFLIYVPNAKIIHIHFSWSVSAVRKMPFFVMSKLFGKKIILHLHSGAEPIIESKAKLIYRYMFKKADITIFLADSIRKKINEHFYLKNSNIIYNPCLLSPMKVDSINSLYNIILFTGTLTGKKGYKDLIKAFSKVSKKNPKWKLVLAGNGEIEKGKTLTKKLGISNQVKFTGWVSGQMKDDLFKRASIFCLPSYNEGFPMAILDAWAYGIPVVTTPVGGLPDILEHGKNAMVFEPGDVDALAKNLKELISNKKLRNKLSKKSLLLSQNEFNIKTISVQLDEIYNQLIN